jgi:hypothetical protein
MQSLKVLLLSQATVTSVLFLRCVTALCHVITESFPTLVNKDKQTQGYKKLDAFRSSLGFESQARPPILRGF